MDVTGRFLKYVSFDTQSDEKSEGTPSTDRQLVLARYLADELEKTGLEHVVLDRYGRVYAYLPASDGCEKDDVIGFIAHMDTSPSVSGKNVKPKTVDYVCGDIRLNESVSISCEEFPFIENYAGRRLIVTDGTTLLGADDKAGIAEIITAMEYLIAHPEIKHGKISIAFTPDEEIGCGADHFNHELFGAKYAYTLDGGELGELEYENFNAAAVKITVNGMNIHPGTAKNKMKNAVLIASQLISMMPAAEAPAHTEGYEGFYHVDGISGDVSRTVIEMIIRDHDRNKFNSRKEFVRELARYLDSVYGEGTVVCDIRDSYYNMKEKILPVMYVIDRAAEAMREAGVEPVTVPIRGGTDGARLSFEGLPCPNLSTGGGNFHSVHEFVCIESMEKMTEVIVNIAKKKS